MHWHYGFLSFLAGEEEMSARLLISDFWGHVVSALLPLIVKSS